MIESSERSIEKPVYKNLTKVMKRSIIKKSVNLQKTVFFDTVYILKCILEIESKTNDTTSQNKDFAKLKGGNT